MLLLEANDVEVCVQDRLLVKTERLEIHTKDRIGLVGKNGSGKTSLLSVLNGDTHPDKGSVTSHYTCALLPQLKRTDTTKSGGEITQQYIRNCLLRNDEILLADEPTTHLDMEHIDWLEKSLLHWQGAFVIVSHDRTFLDAVCNKIWEIDEQQQLQDYTGNYSAFTTQKQLKEQQHEMAYDKYVKKKKQLESALELKEKKAQKATKKPKSVSTSEAKLTGAKPYFAKKQKKLQKTSKAIETRLSKLDKIEKPREITKIKMNIPNESTIKNRAIIRLENVSGFVGNRKIWEQTSFHVNGGDKLAILGRNGSGKTTLIKKIMHADENVYVSPAVKIGYFSQNIDILDSNKSILENVSSTSIQDETFIRTVLARLHFFRDDVYKLVNVLSGGERVKVALAKIFVSNCNTLLLDEPTNFLDIEAVEALESLLQEYEGTVLFISHDRRFIKNIATKTLTIENKKIDFFNGSYKEYKQQKPLEVRNSLEDELLMIDTKITDILSRLSIEPTEELEVQFQELLAIKRALTENE
ncbi:Vga family ABC-F type ribosomal protection protein [Evansella cellulosilytica]|uniref:ABC transporter related protein n=1 Tax=Evansella cellulosilytica (strain ATCC 21833 / DSM 2522 / FERM P-1141 / JCM 9156 / N-4) TaxID=649639 RepID=E6TXG7_EVAC2|nr:ABC-F type ribosomal protection protein [Evansella cellulosilytica]ADU28781.1 ABC transporter related protein [Evansella cellulosilytica DSM 2522]